MRFLCSTHFLTSCNAAPVKDALLHFKFLSDFHDRARAEVERGEHFEGASEYRAYLELMGANRSVSLLLDRSEKFRDSGQLVALRIMETADGYEALVRPGGATAPASRDLAAAV